MRHFRNDFAEPKETEVVATFGQAQVLNYPDARLEIPGGTEEGQNTGSRLNEPLLAARNAHLRRVG